jgi:hypothetical protein
MDVLNENPALDFGGLNKEIARRWKAMNERDKRPWVKASKVSFFPTLSPTLSPFPLHSPPRYIHKLCILPSY